jgi:hypothetical protein
MWLIFQSTIIFAVVASNIIGSGRQTDIWPRYLGRGLHGC